MAYYEGEIGPMGGYNNNGFGNGWEGIIGLALVASLFGGWGGFGFGGGRGGYGAGSEMLGYELGKVATTNDVASGFTTNTILGVQREQTLGMQTGFANVQQTLTQGFNGISTQIANCCCNTQSAIADLKYANERQTCSLLEAINGSTQKIIDYMQSEKILALQAENVALKGRISNDAQTAAIVSALNPTPRPAYVVPNPNCCYTTCNGNTII